MDISFVIPAFNEEALIGECIDAIRAECARHGTPMDVIVSDNASTDRTGAVAAAHGARVVRETRKGTGWARQAGFEASTGEVVAFIDADSTLPAGWLDTVERAFRDPKLAAISGPCEFPALNRATRLLIRTYYKGAVFFHAFNRAVFGRASVLQGGNCVIRRSALERIGGFNTDLHFYGDDTDTARRLTPVGKVAFTTRMPIHSSARRIEEEGLVFAGKRYVLNYFWMTFFKKPYHTEHQDIRK
jgi:glycosyltransferase involved in cell wall biosynthesis